MAVTGFAPAITVLVMQLFPLLLILTVLGVIFVAASSSGTNPVIRFLWFITIGWLLGLVWLGLSIMLMATIIFFPIGAYTATKTWKIATLSGSKSPKDAVTDVTVDVENKINQETNLNKEKEQKEAENKDKEEDNFDKLEKLKDLKKDGVLTEEEYQEKKKDLMDEI